MENEKMNEPEVQDTPVFSQPEQEPAGQQSEEIMEAAESAQTAQAEPAPKVTPGKIALMVTAIVLVLAMLVGLVAGTFGLPAAQEAPAETEMAEAVTEPAATVPADGNPDDETCKGTYTVSDEDVKAAADTVVATIGEHKLTNGELQAFYWMQIQSFLSSDYGYYMMYYGVLDISKPLDTQMSFQNTELTWQQYFLSEALNTWRNYLALSDQAKIAGMELSAEDQEFLNNIETSLAESAAYYGLENVEELIYRNMGAGASMEDYIAFQNMLMVGNLYYDTEFEKLSPTREELEAFFTGHEEAYAENGVVREDTYVDVRHILLIPAESETDESGNTVYTDAAWAQCEADAKALLEQWKSGEATEESFAALATEKTQDPGSQTTGGLYENVYKGQMVEPFESWCFDASRAHGDTGLVKTSYGYHIMYYVGSEPAWVSYAEQDYMTEKMNQMLAVLAEQYPMEVDYSAVKLGFVDLAAG